MNGASPSQSVGEPCCTYADPKINGRSLLTYNTVIRVRIYGNKLLPNVTTCHHRLPVQAHQTGSADIDKVKLAEDYTLVVADADGDFHVLVDDIHCRFPGHAGSLVIEGEVYFLGLVADYRPQIDHSRSPYP